MKRKLFILLLVIFTTVFCFAEEKNALLIANSNYKNFGSLATPINEAKDLKKNLESIGFNVQLLVNCSKDDMLDNLYDFERKLSKSGGIGLFHYGGHAVQVNGKNYLIPVDADIPDEKRVATRAVDVDEIMASMTAHSNIVILDACRNNPLPATSGRSATRGLVMTEYRPKNSIIIYSAAAGKVAQDGLFTPILTNHITDTKDFNTIIRDVRKEVLQKSNGEQSPCTYDELTDNIYLNTNKPKASSNVQSTNPQPITPTKQVVENKTQTKTQQTTQTTNTKPASTLSAAPQMIYVQGGKAKLLKNQNYTVTINSFYMSKTEVTQKLYKDVMGDIPKDNYIFPTGDNLPVGYVSWYNAVNFCNALSIKCGYEPCYTIEGKKVTCNWSANGYRLPTEAEWEYAAREGTDNSSYLYSGSNSPYYVGWFSENAKSYRQSVSSLKPNKLGIYDLSGNQWEWCWDWYSDITSLDANNPKGPASGTNKVARGGAINSLYPVPVYERNDCEPSFDWGAAGIRLVQKADK